MKEGIVLLVKEACHGGGGERRGCVPRILDELIGGVNGTAFWVVGVGHGC